MTFDANRDIKIEASQGTDGTAMANGASTPRPPPAEAEHEPSLDDGSVSASLRVSFGDPSDGTPPEVDAARRGGTMS